MSDTPGQAPDSLLPYLDWTAEAMRLVLVRALQHAAAHGLSGGHHFYITFRTDAPGVGMPDRLRAQYAQEMTIVLQHQFWDLSVDKAAAHFTVGLSFSGVPSTLRIPFAAVTAFADPQVKFALRFEVAAPPESEPAAEPAPPDGDVPQVVSLDAFRRRTPRSPEPEKP